MSNPAEIFYPRRARLSFRTTNTQTGNGVCIAADDPAQITAGSLRMAYMQTKQP
jgi:hypothetical protein